MSRRFALFLAVIAAVLVALTLSNIRYSPWTNTSARTVDQRGPLSDAERANIELFERVSPSVVQVAARSAASQSARRRGRRRRRSRFRHRLRLGQ